MTTIAWDGKTMAADRLSTDHKAPVPKLHTLHSGEVVGGCGRHEHVLCAIDWLENGGPKPDLGDDTFTLLMVDVDGRAYTYSNRLVAMPVLTPFHAIGSGSKYAMGAMAALVGAYDAVCIAAEFDHNTGCGVDTIETPRTAEAA